MIPRQLLLLFVLGIGSFPAGLMAQEPPSAANPVTKEDEKRTSPRDSEPLLTPQKVDVAPQAHDDEIARRLTAILEATEWFDAPKVDVRESVVFLYGMTSTQKYRDWAGDLARSTQDVAAVVNRIGIRESSVWDFGPMQAEIEAMWRRGLVATPYVLVGLVILSLSFWMARVGTGLARRFFACRFETPLLQEVLARAAGGFVFLLGIYIVLRVYGLTRLAVTVLGGTGLIGLVLGIAFRDITENFLASIFLSIQRPFRPGDLVQIGSDTGYIQRLNARTTILMTLEGNYVQVPNSTVYKSTITNFMSNPNRRESVVFSIGYRESISDAQAIALKVLQEHPPVLRDPEPWVLVDGLTPELVNLRIYYWINGREHSMVKVRSSVIRLVKRAFQENGIRLPAAPGAALATGQFDALEKAAAEASPREKPTVPRERKAVATRAEGGLDSEEKELQTQADQAGPPEEGQDLLQPVLRESVASADESEDDDRPLQTVGAVESGRVESSNGRR